VCSLSGGLVNVENDVHDDHDWRVDEDDTPSGSTGPAIDHTTGTSSGNYVYLEASGGCTEQEAILLTPCFDLTSGATSPTFSLWYHMYGADMGDLKVDALGDDLVWDMAVVPTLSGDQGNVWRSLTVDLTPYAGGKVVLRISGITGDDFASDVSLDDLQFEKSSSALSPNAPNWGVSLFPNPATSKAAVQISQAQGGEFNVEVFNLLMQPLQSVAGPLQGGQGQVQLDLRDLPSGIYLVRVTANGQSLLKKLEVQK
jgi:hypothetical protein